MSEKKPTEPHGEWEALPPAKKTESPVVIWDSMPAPGDSQAGATAKKDDKVAFEPLPKPKVAGPVVQWIDGVSEKKDR